MAAFPPRATFGAYSSLVPATSGVITHQIPPTSAPRYLRSLTVSLQDQGTEGGGATILTPVCTSLVVVIGDPLTATELFTGILGPVVASTLRAKGTLVFIVQLIGPGSQTFHFGDVVNGPLLLPADKTITIGAGGAITATVTDVAYFLSVNADGWENAEVNYVPLYGPDPRKAALR